MEGELCLGRLTLFLSALAPGAAGLALWGQTLPCLSQSTHEPSDLGLSELLLVTLTSYVLVCR